MYDDYDLDYTFARDHILDEDMYYEMHTHLDQALDSYTHDLDDDYDHRDTLDYDALAYKHYAWYTSTPRNHSIMYTKRQVEITLTVECYDDLYLQDIVDNTDWNDILSLEGDEKVDISMKEFECRY